MTMKTRRFLSALGGIAAAVLVAAVNSPAFAQVSPPDVSVCDGVDPCDADMGPICSDGGFSIKLKSFTPAPPTTGGMATYVYEICSPVAGTCTSTVRPGESCLDNAFCQKKGQNTDPAATCSRQCAVDTFRALSHLDTVFPALGSSCLSSTTKVTGSCAAVDNTPTDGHTATVGNFILGDGSCFDGATSPNSVAKCDTADINPGDCIDMTINIPGEGTDLGLGAAVVVDKESQTCTASCMAGPSCDTCEELDGGACLTRTIGFWGTHPAIAALYDPVTVCGVVVNGQTAGTCSTSEALCTNADDRKTNTPYLQLVAQLTAAKLNLNATGVLAEGGMCSTWTFNGQTIQEWITTCETNYCGGTKAQISGSMCIEALTAFNESQDTGFDVTPPPFDSPGPADPGQCQLSRGNKKFVGTGGGLGCAP